MFDRLTYKQRNYGMLLLCIILAIVSYKRSFSLTIVAREEVASQSKRIQSAEHSTTDLLMLEKQIEQLNKNIGKSNVKPYTVQKKILESISSFSNRQKVKLEKVEGTHNFETLDFNIYSNQIVLKGGFNGILSYIYFIENEFEYARLSNIDLFTKKDVYTKKTELYGRMLFQNYNQK